MQRLFSQMGRFAIPYPRLMSSSTLYSPSVYLQALRIQRYQVPQSQIFASNAQDPIINHYCEQSIAVLDCLSKKKKRARKKQLRRKGNKIINARNR
ncbi:unnamed protein product (macronuclear) [Paramecium tetraurelia]|uniref:Mitochondrial mRNA-processing protein COX24 C-terminal domain-containing protein n=1 Tax=Paramecium tetraurelia TaxID=5888 RepID=A0CJ14_PARTE|nr:uncharacterized protein GSPATT00007916001 [Paramecium tetraurelia]CAK70781.1 unnamed protein product [Paramecium tetraurelia]|eukprot:XP_001438178.1 hypothetical protein (macronuclear) [Paramecium tetraurelia strain d4-2]